jgi:hypothetical protein
MLNIGVGVTHLSIYPRYDMSKIDLFYFCLYTFFVKE